MAPADDNRSPLERAVEAVGAPEVLAAMVESLPPEQVAQLVYQWEAWARPNQIPPEINPRTGRPWFVALYKCGRGFGKTRVGSEWVRKAVRRYPLVNIIGATADDARDIMVEGESGILRCCPNGERPEYKKSDRSLEWPNGAKTLIFTADEPERFRGKQHMKVWADEIMAWRYTESWDQMILGLRLGDCPQILATTTPRNTPLIKALIADPDTYLVTGSTYDNKRNLAPQFLRKIAEQYEGTRLGRQEIYAEILDDVPGALWQRPRIDELRIRPDADGKIVTPDMQRVVIGVDPSGGAGGDHDEQGIVICGRGIDSHGYVLGDYSCSLTPDGWGRRAVQAWLDFSADKIVVEKNYGGDMAAHVIQTAARAMGVAVNIEDVTSARGKVVRAEPIAALAEQGRQHHVGSFPKLEDQLCSFTNTGIVAPPPAAGKREKRRSISPDRADAMVFAMTDLFMAPQTTMELWSQVEATEDDWKR